MADRILGAFDLGADMRLVETVEFLVERVGEAVGRIAQDDPVLRAALRTLSAAAFKAAAVTDAAPEAVPAATVLANRVIPANDVNLERGVADVSMIGQPRSAARSRNAGSGLTATGWPTAANIGRSLTESE